MLPNGIEPKDRNLLRWFVPLYAMPAHREIPFHSPELPILAYYFLIKNRMVGVFTKEQFVKRLWEEKSGMDMRGIHYPSAPICLACGRIFPYGIEHQMGCAFCKQRVSVHFLLTAQWATMRFETGELDYAK